LIRRSQWWRCSAVGLLLAACGGPAALRYEEQLERTPESAAHAVHGQRLADVMRSLDRLSSERLPKAMDVEVEEGRQAREVARVARAMADSAARIPAAAPADLDDGERAEFLSLARALEQQTQRLVVDAAKLTPDERRARLQAIDTTCDACHRRFRIPGHKSISSSGHLGSTPRCPAI
jgi:cytochrome c556